MKKLFPILVLFAPVIVLAAESGHGAGHEGGIPSAVTFQFINFAIFLGILFYFLRKPVRDYFKGREQGFRQALAKAEAARLEAEAKRREIQDRLNQLEASSAQSIAKAQADALALKEKMLQDAAEMSERLKVEAKRTAQVEIERAKHELREELLGQAMLVAQKTLTDKIAEGDQKRLQTEFVDKIQVVR